MKCLSERRPHRGFLAVASTIAMLTLTTCGGGGETTSMMPTGDGGGTPPGRDQAGLTPVSNLPTAGTATYIGSYTGTVDRRGVGVSQVVGRAEMIATFAAQTMIIVELLPPDPLRPSFARPLTNLELIGETVLMTAPITGNTFGGDVTDTRTVAGHTFPGRTTIMALTGGDLYSPGTASSGKFQGRFLGTLGDEVDGTYEFTIGATSAAGSFGGELQ